MKFREMIDEALNVRERYDSVNLSKGQQVWSVEDYAIGLAVDVGDLLRLIQESDGVRSAHPDTAARLKHEIADCLWSLIVISNELSIDLEQALVDTLKELNVRLSEPSS